MIKTWKRKSQIQRKQCSKRVRPFSLVEVSLAISLPAKKGHDNLWHFLDLANIYTSTYLVQPGDTLLKISMMYKVASKELANVNNIVNDSIYPSQVKSFFKIF